MTKQKKAIWVILGIIIFVFSVFLGLGYLGQITGGNSLIQRTEMNDKYVPEEITKYYPIENLNSKENLLSDENYANSIQDALLSASIEFEQGEEYKAHIDKVIKEFENENYKSVLYISEKNDIESSLTFSKFKIKEVDGKKRFAPVFSCMAASVLSVACKIMLVLRIMLLTNRKINSNNIDFARFLARYRKPLL